MTIINLNILPFMGIKMSTLHATKFTDGKRWELALYDRMSTDGRILNRFACFKLIWNRYPTVMFDSGYIDGLVDIAGDDYLRVGNEIYEALLDVPDHVRRLRVMDKVDGRLTSIETYDSGDLTRYVLNYCTKKP